MLKVPEGLTCSTLHRSANLLWVPSCGFHRGAGGFHGCQLFSLKVTSNSFATPRTVARQAPLPMEFSRQEYWSGLPFPSTGDLPDPGIKPVSPAWQVNSLSLSHPGSRKIPLFPLGNVPSSSVFWKSLRRSDINSYLTISQNSWVKPCDLQFFFVGEFLITDSISFMLLVCSDFLFLNESVLVGCMFLGMYPSFLGCPIFWYIIVHCRQRSM